MSDEKKKNDNALLGKGWKKDFGVGMVAGAAGTLAALPFDKVIDPITAKNYHEATQVQLTPEIEAHLQKTNPNLLKKFEQGASSKQTVTELINGVPHERVFETPGKKTLQRSFGRYLMDQTKTTFAKDPYSGKLTSELKTLPLKMVEKGMVFGTSMLAAGALYRALGDKQPVEKNAALQFIGNFFNEASRNISR